MDANDNRKRNRILLLLFLGVLMGALDIAIVAPALPAIQGYFKIGDRALAWVFTIYVLFNLVSTPLMAKLSDTLGRRTIYVLDVSLFAVGSLIVALSPAFGVLLVGRAIQGLGAGGIFPVASAVIGDTFPPEKRGSALGLIGAVFGIAFLVGPILGGVILGLLSWHWLFLINLPIAAVLIAASLRLLPNTRPATRKRFDFVGLIVLAISLASLAYGINQIDTNAFFTSVASLSVWPFLALALILAPVFWWLERRVPDPILRVSLFSSRQIAVICGVAFGAGIGEAALVFVPKLLVSAFGITESRASYMLLPAVLAMAVGSPLAGRGLDKVGSRVVVFAGAVLTAIGMFIVGLLSITWVTFIASALFVGLGMGILLGAPLRYVMLNEAPPDVRASGQGALTLFTSTGQMMGAALVGAVAASFGGGADGYQRSYLFVAVAAIFLIALALALKSRADELDAARQNEARRVSKPA